MSVCLLVTFVSPAKTAELIKTPFGGLPWVSQRNMYYVKVQIPKGKGQLFGGSPLKNKRLITPVFQAVKNQ